MSDPRSRGTTESVASRIEELRQLASLSQSDLAQLLGTSPVALAQWERGDRIPSAQQSQHIAELLKQAKQGTLPAKPRIVLQNGTFASRGSRKHSRNLAQLSFTSTSLTVERSGSPLAPVISRIKNGRFFGSGEQTLASLLLARQAAAETAGTPAAAGVSAGKNTYTYDAHTYHTKVPPQGIVEFLRHYLPSGGLVFDPFAGSGMTGVAARAAGCDVILNELSPAACFISHNFTEAVSPDLFGQAVSIVLHQTEAVRKDLYTTTCRECGRETEILYTVWSYRVGCPECGTEFRLWDACRQYGRTVREHRILAEFPCPHCGKTLKKRSLARTWAEPVLLGYRCCRPSQIEHPPDVADLERIRAIESSPPLADNFYPQTPLPDGVNLSQPKRHGILSVDQFYTPRNLAALSHLWREIHHLEDPALASVAAFVFTSLYQRVTRCSEFRFWGGSGNTARLNVPFIFNEANVFVTFKRKALTIFDHLATTARSFSGRKVVVCNTATNLDYLPTGSVDFIFTDPPFGANINYSEMNLLWESWLGEFTDPTDEVIVNRSQHKTVDDYEELMKASMAECFRVLRPGRWMLLAFMNSSANVWAALVNAVLSVGFATEEISMFDKQHGTFKQFVSDNTAGCDLVLHCRKPENAATQTRLDTHVLATESITTFLSGRTQSTPMVAYLHVARGAELDFRLLYSEWLAYGLTRGHELADFAVFRSCASDWISRNKRGEAE